MNVEEYTKVMDWLKKEKITKRTMEDVYLNTVAETIFRGDWSIEEAKEKFELGIRSHLFAIKKLANESKQNTQGG